MSILISPSDNRGWGAGMRRRRAGMRGVGLGGVLTLRRLLGAGVKTATKMRSMRRRRMRGGAKTSTTTKIVAVTTRRRRPTQRRRR